MISTKHKLNIFKKALALAGALIISMNLATQALADIIWAGNPGSAGSVVTDDSSKIRYGYYGSDFKVSWRVSLYVATTANGMIDPQKHKPGSGLGYVGTILYDNFDHSNNVYIQLNQHTETRFSSVSNYTDYPYVSLVESSDKKLKNSNSGHNTPIYHSVGNCGLPKYVSACSAQSIKDTVESPAFASMVIGDLNDFLGGTSDNLNPLYIQAGVNLGSGPKSKIISANYDYSLMLPTTPNGSPNPDCIVEWVCVVEPLVGYQTVASSAFFEANSYTSDGAKQPIMCGFNQIGTTLAIDAYAVSYYNAKSIKDYSDPVYVNKIMEDFPDFKPYTTWSGGTDNYSDKGKLRCEISTNLNNSARVCYDVHSTSYSSYCGFPVAGNNGANLSYRDYPTETPTYGGISVYKTEIAEPEETGIPVYYYIYDEFNEFSGEVYVDSFNAEDNEKAAFKASEEYFAKQST